MTRNPVTIASADTLATAAAKMSAGRFRRLPVVDRGELLGIVTDRDLREHHGHLHDTKVTGAMVEDLVTIAPSATLEAAAQLMLDRNVGGLPVVEGGALVGIITTSDVLRAFLAVTGASEEGTVRLDLVFEREPFDLSDASRIISAAGGEILGLGLHREKWDGHAVFFVRIRADDPQKVADALAANGYSVLGVHSAAAKTAAPDAAAAHPG